VPAISIVDGRIAGFTVRPRAYGAEEPELKVPT